MLIVAGFNSSQLAVALAAAPAFLLPRDRAQALIRAMVETIRGNWDAVCDEANLTATERDVLWNGAFLRPFAFQGLDDAFRAELGAA
jgi:serine/threonine-protein kinase HipA